MRHILPAEIFVPFAYPGEPSFPTAVRSTLIVSSIQALRHHGYYDAYVAALGGAREEIVSLIAGQWIRVELGLEHYRAADRLGLQPRTIDIIGSDVAERVRKTGLAVAMKITREAGVTPWTALSLAHRIREATWKGTDVAVFRLGPKEARFDWVGLPFAAIPYYVTSFGGFLRSYVRLFCSTAYTHLVPPRCSATSLSYRISWV